MPIKTFANKITFKCILNTLGVLYRTGNCGIRLTFVNNEDWHFKLRRHHRSRDARAIGGEGEDFWFLNDPHIVSNGFTTLIYAIKLPPTILLTLHKQFFNHSNIRIYICDCCTHE